MRLSYVQIENFRNFKHCGVTLGQNIILIGENKAGKSNFIEALRLVLDPSLSDTDRQLSSQDFWDGDGEEPFDGRSIKVTVRFSDFADGEPEYVPLTWLSSCLIETSPRKVAQLTYVYYPDNGTDPSNEEASQDERQTEVFQDEDSYKWTIYPRNDPDESFAIRGLWTDMPMRYVSALRDMARDNRVWQRSPLNQLVKLSGLTSGQLDAYAGEIAETSARIVSDQVSLTNLEHEIQNRLLEMIGQLHTVDPKLGLDATTPEALLRALRLFIDGLRGRPMDRTSLGLQNVIYLALLSLELDKKTEKRGSQKKPYIPIVALEEPEAHLHPHLQRLVFEDFLSRANERRQPTIISSHSPSLVCIADVGDLVLLKDHGTEGSKAYSAYEFLQALGERERKDLARFLDITKAEMLFSRGALFVEGDVEVILLDTFAEILGTSLDQYGISIINVYGTAFQHVVTLALKLTIPFAVLTDGDKFNSVTGLQRGLDLLSTLDPAQRTELQELINAGRLEDVRIALKALGIFVNEWTLEPSLMAAGLGAELKATFEELGNELGAVVKAGAQHIDAYASDPSDDNMKRIIAAISDTRWGKGRFAHRLSRHIQARATSIVDEEERRSLVPQYIREAVEYLVNRIQGLPNEENGP